MIGLTHASETRIAGCEVWGWGLGFGIWGFGYDGYPSRVIYISPLSVSFDGSQLMFVTVAGAASHPHDLPPMRGAQARKLENALWQRRPSNRLHRTRLACKRQAFASLVLGKVFDKIGLVHRHRCHLLDVRIWTSRISW